MKGTHRCVLAFPRPLYYKMRTALLQVQLYYKKVWSTPFIWIEALVSPRTNKQYSTPVWRLCIQHGTPNKVMNELPIPVLAKFTRFLSKDKSENTFIKHVRQSVD